MPDLVPQTPTKQPAERQLTTNTSTEVYGGADLGGDLQPLPTMNSALPPKERA